MLHLHLTNPVSAWGAIAIDSQGSWRGAVHLKSRWRPALDAELEAILLSLNLAKHTNATKVVILSDSMIVDILKDDFLRCPWHFRNCWRVSLMAYPSDQLALQKI